MLNLSGLFRGGLLCLTLALGSCAGGTDSFDQILSNSNFGPRQVEAQDFVKASRPDPNSLDYLPIGFETKNHDTKVRTANEVAADDVALRGAAARAGALGTNANMSQSPKTSPKKKHDAEDNPDLLPGEN